MQFREQARTSCDMRWRVLCNTVLYCAVLCCAAHWRMTWVHQCKASQCQAHNNLVESVSHGYPFVCSLRTTQMDTKTIWNTNCTKRNAQYKNIHALSEQSARTVTNDNYDDDDDDDYIDDSTGHLKESWVRNKFFSTITAILLSFGFIKKRAVLSRDLFWQHSHFVAVFAMMLLLLSCLLLRFFCFIFFFEIYGRRPN